MEERAEVAHDDPRQQSRVRQSGGAVSAPAWQNACAYLRREVGEDVFKSWFETLEFAGIEGDTAVLHVSTRFNRDWLRDNFGDRLRSALNYAGFKVARVRLDLAAGRPAAAAAPHAPPPAQTPAPAHPQAAGAASAASAAPARSGPASVGQAAASVARQAGPSTGAGEAVLEPRYTFDRFVVGKSNELAYAAANRVADAGEVPFNPLFLHGGVGLGKTHLMHAIAWAVRQRSPEKRVMYLSAERFMLQFIHAMRHQDSVRFKEQFQKIDLLMIDDVQFIAHKDRTQEEFFHTFNALVDNRRQVVISADRSPTDLEGIEERIISRLGWGLVADIHPTDYELRLGILQSKAEKAAHVTFPDDVLDFLAYRITSNVRELEGAFNRVLAYAELVGRPVSRDMAREVLQDLLRANDRKVSIEDIQKAVADYYNLRLTEMLSQRRARMIARPRQVAMYLSKQLTSRSLPEIGRKFAGRDHTTVMHAVKTIENLRQTDSAIEDDINRLTRALMG
ncbi:chromosomal replication initiation protein DnaA [Rhodothalassium salexigens]|uniref:chromosomal replication initiator protein DnaA n=1 Tax=Rhodothalassium salexigens TaxID=1086 RepID=UPI001913E836|nr:chromosomal replication initiator protein DnaA [Rhodothalassium salexigens]MBK5912137.1 chromosomal replication initiation protein DnaA [Rhodothalassium salexigens]MBK5921817.1 chromosomal replication initiation protein DnaA [Rhodothalassium salexigens]